MDAFGHNSQPRAGWTAARLVATLCVGAWLAGPVSAATFTDPTQPIALEAASSDFDYRKNLLVFRKIRIAQGELSVEADEATATGLDFENSEWKFTGAVHIRMPNGLLDSTAATITFRGNQLTQALITGSPAAFEQRRVEQQVARGRAGTIHYDVTRGTIELKGQAWLTDGQNEITGQTLVYDMTKERVFANPGEQDPGGVNITINPRTLTPPARVPLPGAAATP